MDKRGLERRGKCELVRQMHTVTGGGRDKYLKHVAHAVEDMFALSSEGFQDVTFCSVVSGRVVVLSRGGLRWSAIEAHGPSDRTSHSGPSVFRMR